jgi:hypothetical protein
MCTSIPGRETGNLARTYMDGGISALFRDMSFASVNFTSSKQAFLNGNTDSLKADSMTQGK